MVTSRDDGRRSPLIVADLPGHPLKPDPLTARTLQELEELLHAYWLWSGRPSARTVANGSNGAFSHSTAAKLLYPRGTKPALSLPYLCGWLRGCGADLEELQRWATAWRRIHMPPPSDDQEAPDGEAPDDD